MDELGLEDQIDWSKAVVDSSSVRALFWEGAKTGPNSTDRGKNGSKRHLISDGKGIPLAVIHTGAIVHYSQQAIPLVDAIPAIKCPRGGRRRRPDTLYADRAYDVEAKIRKPLRQRRIIPMIAKGYTEHGSCFGKHRSIIESVFAWLFQYRRLRVRYKNATTSTKLSFPSDAL